MTHDPATTEPTTPLTNSSTDQSQHDHARAAHPTSRRHLKINNFTAHLKINNFTAYPCIPIRRKDKSRKTASSVWILKSPGFDLEGGCWSC